MVSSIGCEEGRGRLQCTGGYETRWLDSRLENDAKSCSRRASRKELEPVERRLALAEISNLFGQP